MKDKAIRLAVIGLSLAVAAWGQNAISARAGLIHLAEGDVFLNGKPVVLKMTDLVDIKKGQTLSTEEGRAEILLAPGTFLRMPESSEIRMISSNIEDVRVEVVKGEALVEVAELLDHCTLTLSLKDSTLTVSKPGLYRLSEDPSRLQVYEGEAVAQAGEQRWTLKGGRQLVADAGVWTPGKFDPKSGDGLYRWAKRRSGYIAMANVAAARQARLNTGGALGASSWMYNPYFGMWTYLPYRGSYYSPFGYRWWSPVTVVQAYTSPSVSGGGGASSGTRGFTPSFDSSLGYSVTGGRSYGGTYSGSSGSVGSAPAASSSGAAVGSTGGARGSGGSGGEAGGRGGGGGRGN